MELDDILALQDLQFMTPSEISFNFDPALQDYIAHYDDFDLFMRLSDDHPPPQLAEISSPACIDTKIIHTNPNHFPRNQPHDCADVTSSDQAANNNDHHSATGNSMTFLHSLLDHLDAAVQPDDSAATKRRGAKHDQQAAAGRLVSFQSSDNDHNHNYQQAVAGRLMHLQSSANDQQAVAGRSLYLQSSDIDQNYNDQDEKTAGLSLEEDEKRAAGGLQKHPDHYDSSDEQVAGASSEEEGMNSCSSSSSMEEKTKKRTSGRLSSSSCKTYNKRDSRLKPHRGSHSTEITKRPSHVIPPPQSYRRPIIIHTYSPKIIHTSPSKFMWLIQSLTGSPETRSRCLQNPPPAHHDHLLHGTISAASMEAQDTMPPAHAPSYHDDKLPPKQADSIETASYHHDKYHASRSAPLNSYAIIPNLASHYQTNYSFNYTNNVITSLCRSPSNHNTNQSLMQTSPNPLSQAPSNLSISDANYTSTSGCSTMEVLPRGPLICGREWISGGRVAALPAPKFESWPLDHDQMKASSEQNINYLSNLNVQEANPNYLSNPNYVAKSEN